MPAAALVPAASLSAPAALIAAPLASPLPAPSLPAAPARTAASPASAPKDDAAAVDAGRALFDQAAHAGRPLGEGVFIQQEHEGSLLSRDARVSSGNVF